MADLSTGTQPFKCGDWVQWVHGPFDCTHRHCLFLQPLEEGLALIDDRRHAFTVLATELEPDEAPE